MYPINSKTKIMHIVNSLKVGGLEQVVVNLVNRFDSAKYEQLICCIDSSGPMQERISVPVKIYVVGKGAKADYLMPLKIAKIIRIERPDIVHTRNWSAIDGVIGAILGGVKTIIHDEHGRDANDPFGANLKRKLVRKVLSPWINRFIPVSNELEKWLVDDVGVARHKVLKIINGVDSELFVPPQDKYAAKRLQGIPPSSFVIGFVGRLDPVKDIHTLIRAFSIFSARSSCDARLIIVGNGPEHEALQAESIELGIASKVIFTGERSDICELMKCFDIFALTSIAEGIPMTILEAMASGLPVVATDVGGVGELVCDRQSGFLCPSKDVNKISEYLFNYSINPSLVTAHGHKSREIVVNDMSLSSMVQKYEELYSSRA